MDGAYDISMSEISFQEEPRGGYYVANQNPKGLTGFLMKIFKIQDEGSVHNIMVGIAIFFFLATLFVILF